MGDGGGARTDERKNETGDCASQVSFSGTWQKPNQNWQKGDLTGSQAWERCTWIRDSDRVVGTRILSTLLSSFGPILFPLQTAFLHAGARGGHGHRQHGGHNVLAPEAGD